MFFFDKKSFVHEANFMHGGTKIKAKEIDKTFSKSSLSLVMPMAASPENSSLYCLKKIFLTGPVLIKTPEYILAKWTSFNTKRIRTGALVIN